MATSTGHAFDAAADSEPSPASAAIVDTGKRSIAIPPGNVRVGGDGAAPAKVDTTSNVAAPATIQSQSENNRKKSTVMSPNAERQGEQTKRSRPAVRKDAPTSKANATIPIIRAQDPPERIIAITIPPGRLGLTVNFLNGGGAAAATTGATIEKILPSCPFEREVRIGDRIATVAGRALLAPGDLRFGSDGAREMIIVRRGAAERGARDDERARRDVPSLSRNGRRRGYLPGPGKLLLVEREDDNNNAASASASASAVAASGKRKRDESDAGSAAPNERTKARARTNREKRQRDGFDRRLLARRDHRADRLAERGAEDGWDHRCGQLRRYAERHRGDDGAAAAPVPPEYKAPDDETLGRWAERQRRLYREEEGGLAPERIAYLEREGFDFEYIPAPSGVFTGDEEFDTKLQEMIEYRKAHNGERDVPYSYPPGEGLGQWVHRQRDLYEKDALDPGHHAVLEEKGFLFEPGKKVTKTIIDKYWKLNFKELQQFKLDHGHLDVPTDYKASSLSAYLDRWLSKQKNLFKKKELSFHRVRMLESLGLDLHAKKKTAGGKMEALWDQMCNEVIAYRDEHGHCCVPTNSASGKLGRWVRVQRKYYNKGELREDRLLRLQAIGFVFDPKLKNTWDNVTPSNDSSHPIKAIFSSQVWISSYEALKQFVESNGHANVPPLYRDSNMEGSLHTWLETQKKFFEQDTLPSQSIEMLESLGVNLSEKSDYTATRLDVGWMRTFSFLEQFHQKHGHANVSADYVTPDVDPQVCEEFGGERRLGKWLIRQRIYYRQNKLLEDRAKKLESLGVEWNLREKPELRAKRKQRTLEEEREFPLMKTKQDVRWLNTYVALEKYHRDHGHADVPLGYELPDVDEYKDFDGDRRLGHWIQNQHRYHTQAKERLPEYRKKKLESLGIKFQQGQYSSKTL